MAARSRPCTPRRPRARTSATIYICCSCTASLLRSWVVRAQLGVCISLQGAPVPSALFVAHFQWQAPTCRRQLSNCTCPLAVAHMWVAFKDASLARVFGSAFFRERVRLVGCSFACCCSCTAAAISREARPGLRRSLKATSRPGLHEALIGTKMLTSTPSQQLTAVSPEKGSRGHLELLFCQSCHTV